MMRRSAVAIVMLALLATVSPGQAVNAEAFVVAGQLVEAYQIEGAETEVRLQAWTGTELDPELSPREENGACLSLFRDNVAEEGCSVDVTVTASPGLAAVFVQGTIETTVFDYDPETVSFTERGTSLVTLDLTMTAESLAGIQHQPNMTSPWVCGLPPDIPTGGGLILNIQAERTGPMDGQLHSTELGDIDATEIYGEGRQVTFLVAGACL